MPFFIDPLLIIMLYLITMHRKKIAIINDQPHYSGTGTYAWHLADILTNNREYTIDHLFLDYGKRSIIKNPGLSDQKQLGFVQKIPIVDSKPLFWRKALRFIEGYDLYHFTSQNMSFLVPKVQAPAVVTCLDIIPYLYPERFMEKSWRFYLYSGIKKAWGIIAISEATKADLIKYFGIQPEKVKVTYLGAGPEFVPRNKGEIRKKLSLPDGIKIILHVGTAAARKRVSLLIKSFAMVNSSDTIMLRLGRSTGDHLKLCEKLGVIKRVKFIENVSREDLPLYYSAADLFVFPSSYEGFGLPPLEAMASGCPVLAANCSSIPEVTGDAAMLQDSEDPNDWAASIDRILSDEKLYNRMRGEGLKRAQTFAWQKTADGTLELYNDLLLRKDVQ
jgi:glycosyltransferase involved in cell wall biosynthesis